MSTADVTSGPELAVECGAAPPEGWDAFVADDPNGSFCHLGRWGEVFDRALRLEMSYLTAWNGSTIEGLMPMVRMPGLPSGTSLVSVPYLNYGGPLGSVRARSALVEAAVAEARRAGDRRIELRARHPVGADLPEGREKITVILDLPEDPTTLFEDEFRSKLRSQIRRPMKEDMEVRFGSGERQAFYHVFSRNMRDLGTPVLPHLLFSEIAGTFPDLVRFGVVYHEGEPVAGGCGFRWGEEFEMTWASSLREYNRLAPNMLLYWAFMERCIEEGVRRFNFGRCTPGGGTHRFKRQWGGEDVPLSWLQWPAAADSPDPSSGFYGFATSVWRRLPLPVANRLGPLIARRLPAF